MILGSKSDSRGRQIIKKQKKVSYALKKIFFSQILFFFFFLQKQIIFIQSNREITSLTPLKM